jgi:tetratricopeptide (TPR) repeat protein
LSLQLQGALRWQPAKGQAQPWPVTLPAAILLVLARGGQWQARSQLATLFWPDVPQATALLNLRVNLHKARGLVKTWRGAPALECEPRRVRWVPLTHVPAPEPGEASEQHELAAGFDLPGFDAFAAWLHDWRGAVGADPPRDERPAGSLLARGDAMARLRGSAAAVVVVGGEPGVGKTRLVSEAFAGSPWLHCHQGLQSLSFGPVATLFAEHRAWWRDFGAYRLDAARLLPDIAPDEPLPPLDAMTARVRLFEGLAQCVERNAPRLLVDDLQWADPATVDWLVLLAHRGQLRWVATARMDEIPPATAKALEHLMLAGLTELIPLQGLGREALGALLQQWRPDLAAGAHAASWGDAILAYTAGNAFCAIEVMGALAPGDQPAQLPSLPLPGRLLNHLLARRERLAPAAQALVDAASLALGSPALSQLAAMTRLDETSALAALEQAQRSGLMAGTRCRHDLIRQALGGEVSAVRASALHQRAAQHLAQHGGAPELVAHHWRAAGQPARAWPFVMRAAQGLRQRGEHGAAVELLHALRDGTADRTLTLRARTMLAQERLFDDLLACRAELEQVLARAGALPAGQARRTIEVHALAGLVDGAVFSGDLERAQWLGRELRDRLGGVPRDVRIEAHQVLIETHMRDGDFDAANASLKALRRAGAADAVVLSFEAQIHWFGGDVVAARQAFEFLLERHADYCRGLTIENDLAVMCHALGDLDRAEVMARRSLRSWAGVPHTLALSSLVLGATLVSRGAYDEARSVLDEARRIGQQQGSTLFVGEALVRLARLHWGAGDAQAARAATRSARKQIGAVSEPLRASALAMMEVLAGAGTRVRQAAHAELTALCARSRHPLVHARRWRAEVAWCQAAGERAAALAAARQLHAVAGAASLAEWQCEALSLVAALVTGAAAAAARRAADDLALRHGFAVAAGLSAAPRVKRA